MASILIYSHKIKKKKQKNKKTFAFISYYQLEIEAADGGRYEEAKVFKKKSDKLLEIRRAKVEREEEEGLNPDEKMMYYLIILLSLFNLYIHLILG